MCDLGYVIKDHVDVLLQVLTDELRGTDVQIDSTKCLSTAVMTMYLLLGPERGPALSHQCDTRAVRGRARRGVPDGPDAGRARAAEMLEQAALGPEDRGKRTLFYVMLTDGYMSSPSGESRYFPGHVFVLERLPRGTFNMYQSYVEKYDIGNHIDRRTLSMGRTAVRKMLRGLRAVLSRGVWDARATRYWTELTDVDSAQYESWAFGDAMLLCFRTADTDACLANLRDLVSRKLKGLRRLPRAALGHVFGASEAYNTAEDTRRPRRPLLTNAEVRSSLEELYAKIS